jgi:hypothetical protein
VTADPTPHKSRDFLGRTKTFHLSLPREWSGTKKHIASVLFTFASSNDGGGICASIKTLARHAGEHERTVERVLRELRSQGMLVDDGFRTFERQNGDKLRVKMRRLLLSAIRRVEEVEPDILDGFDARPSERQPDIRAGFDQVEPDIRDRLDQSNPTFRAIEPDTGDTQTEYRTERSTEPRRSTRTRSFIDGNDPIDQEFDRWWQIVLKKVDKTEARKLFRRIRSRNEVSFEMLFSTMTRHAAYHRNEPRYSTGPAKWLRGRKWEDELPSAPSLTTPAAQNANGGGLFGAAVRMAERNRLSEDQSND